MSETLERGEFVRLAYRLGLSRATGVLTVVPSAGSPAVLVLRRGFLMAPDTDPLYRKAAQRLARIAGFERATYRFDGGTMAYPPGATERQFALAAWARQHLERQIDSGRAQQLVSMLAGSRLVLRPDLVPYDSLLDDTDRRIIAAMRVPRRLDQIWPLARTPRYRLLTFIHFLREVGAVGFEGIAAPAPRMSTAQDAARRTLGLEPAADKTAAKRAYRRLARALHPDLHPSATAERRRLLERRLSEVNAAYRQIIGE